ncbi:MAG TPA: 2-dehydro-3-deoxygalactonokinase [Steroidobacteraceae bacterium]|jgi:2-dehydro-3-deoxygalactonokinase|nr:2-dehydro-3-deoxygalactonokinase [Steroidobacteraceae bacterium]
MTYPAAFIAGDWGTSNLTLALCDEDGQALETRQGPGAADSRGRFPDVFDDLAAGWRASHGALPAVLCGMVGSAFGWREAPYLSCPADLYELADEPMLARAGVRIVPGMRCTNPLGAPDVMRGEETQLFGAQCMDATMSVGKQLVCMPGTHTKWVSLNGSVVQEFLTAPTGELFAMLCEHSVLVRDKATPIERSARDFERGLAQSAKHPDASLLHQLFQSRSLRLDKQLSAEGAASWMSGLLIGSDVGGALPLFAGHDAGAPVYVIGSPQLTASYALALARRGRNAIQVDGVKAALAGLGYVYREQERQNS